MDIDDRSPAWFGAGDYGMDTGPSAVAIVDLACKLVLPMSVVDVGCGKGRFLEEFEGQGVLSILGLDGLPAAKAFGPDRSKFLVVDLTKPVVIDRRFDLALCLEVAEHLPPESADLLVKTLTDMAPIVIFSAAHPNQGGQGHINEQWPTYWYRRFARHGYVALDLLRGPLSDIPEVLDCYRRNLVLYVESSRVAEILARADDLDVPDAYVLAHQKGITVDLLHQPWRVLVGTLVRKLTKRLRFYRG